MVLPILRRLQLLLLAVVAAPGLAACGASARQSASAPVSRPAAQTAAASQARDPTVARPKRHPRPAANPAAASLSSAPRVSGGAQTSGKVGSTPDPRPAAAGNATVAPGAPSDAEIRKQLGQERKAGIVAPSGDTAQSIEQGATYVGAPGGTWAFPIQPLSVVLGPSTWSQDQGVDMATSGAACGVAAVEVAITDGTVVQEGISGFGPAAPVVRIDQGPWKGWSVYYGHAFPDYVHVGDHVRTGQPVASVGCGIVGLSSGPHLEIGLSPPGRGYCCPGRGQTSPAVDALMQQLYARSQH
jgi:murein DD-endopeptidase MepM/ murein hydrolase activator NlpD